jgi:hypothetical protein
LDVHACQEQDAFLEAARECDAAGEAGEDKEVQAGGVFVRQGLCLLEVEELCAGPGGELGEEDVAEFRAAEGCVGCEVGVQAEVAFCG